MDTGALVIKNTTVATNYPTKFEHTRYKIINFSRDVSLTGSSVSYTGVGFAPKFIVFNFIWTNNCWGIGSDDGTTHQAKLMRGTSSVNYTYSTSVSIDIYNAAGTKEPQNAYVSTFDADGFTLLWVNPDVGETGIAYISADCYR